MLHVEFTYERAVSGSPSLAVDLPIGSRECTPVELRRADGEASTCGTPLRALGMMLADATTLRHYADPVSDVDRRAAAYLAETFPVG
jgi:hypothetical protein